MALFHSQTRRHMINSIIVNVSKRFLIRIFNSVNTVILLFYTTCTTIIYITTYLDYARLQAPWTVFLTAKHI